MWEFVPTSSSSLRKKYINNLVPLLEATLAVGGGGGKCGVKLSQPSASYLVNQWKCIVVPSAEEGSIRFKDFILW